MEPITVMTWNVRYFGHGLRGMRATRSGLRKSARALAHLAKLPDVIALQEVETRSLRAGMGATPQLERFRAAFHDALLEVGREDAYEALYYPAHRYQFRDAPAVYTTGLAMLVGPRLRVADHNATDPHDITHVRVPLFGRFKQRRVVGHARVVDRATDQHLDVFNTHLSLPAFFEVGPTKIAKRMGDGSNQLAEVAALLDFVQDRRDDAAVIVGDFNTRPGSPAYHAILDAGFRDAYADVHDLAVDDLHAHGTAGFGPQRMHIDHVFSTEAVRWQAMRAFPFGDRHHFHGLSDHTPKVGDLIVRNT